MKHTKTEWAYLAQKRIKSVYYSDEHGQFGAYDQKLGVHLLSYGSILLLLDSGEWLSLENDDEREGLTLFHAAATMAEGFHQIPPKRDPIWSQLSDLTLKRIEIYLGQFLVGQAEGKSASKAIRKTIHASIELVFQHGESLFISIAEINENHELEQSLFGLALYTRRETGVLYGLIP